MTPPEVVEKPSGESSVRVENSDTGGVTVVNNTTQFTFQMPTQNPTVAMVPPVVIVETDTTGEFCNFYMLMFLFGFLFFPFCFVAMCGLRSDKSQEVWAGKLASVFVAIIVIIAIVAGVAG